MKLSLAKKRVNLTSTSAIDTSLAKRRRQDEDQHSSVWLSDSYKKLEERCGKINNIHLTNFMCHANLSIDFHKRVNFLIGSNGSGKSAIIAALVIGLGSNAKATSRSTNLKQFIKTGEQSSKIEITLSNNGPCSYKKHIYGKQITITRLLSTAGSSYTIKDENGKIVGRKADELKVITLFHNIQVENPIFVLNQENSREFLKDFDPKKNYSMFMKATQLEIITETLNTCLIIHKTNASQLKLERKKVHDNIEFIKMNKEKLAILKSFNALKCKLKTKECERLWLVVFQIEDSIKEKLKSLEIQEEKCNELKNTLNKKDEIEVKLNQEIRNYNVEIENTKQKFREEEASLNQLRDSLKKYCNSIQGLRSQSDIIRNKILHTDKDILEINKKLEESKNSASDLKEMRQRHDEEEKALNDEIEKNILVLNNIRENQQSSLGRRIQLHEKITEIRAITNSSRTKLSYLAHKMQSLKSAIKNKISVFSDNALMLRNLIKKHSEKFSQSPKGPIGYYIDVPNPKFRDIIEHILGKQLLESFIVNNAHDRKIIQSLIKSNFPSDVYSPNVIQVKFRSNVYNTSKGQTTPTRGTTLLMNEIKFNDVDVMNCLIDYRQPEQILLTEQLEIATNICSQRENVPNRMVKIYVTKHNMEVYPTPKYRMYSINVRPAKLIAVDQQNQISQLENESKEMELKIKSLEKEDINLKSTLESVNEFLGDKHRKKIEIENIIQDLKKKLLEMDNKVFPDSNYMDLLKKALEDVERQKTALQTKIESIQNERNNYELKMKETEQQINMQKNTLENINEEMEQQKKLILDTKSKLASLGQNFKQKALRIQKDEKLLMEMKQINENLNKNLQAATKEAEKKGERIQSELTMEEIVEEIETIERQLTTQSGCNETIEELEQKIADAELSAITNEKKYDIMRQCFQTLRNSLLSRFEFITKFKTHMVITFQHAFVRLLGLRDFKGKIDVNHNDKTMTISVIPRGNQKEHTVSSTKSLSGGERSYSTVAFLISLWSCVDHPFYFLDEYDVFTDDVNREFMTRLLLSEGENRINRQFCFSTPLDTDIPNKQYIKIHKLSEPERY